MIERRLGIPQTVEHVVEPFENGPRKFEVAIPIAHDPVLINLQNTGSTWPNYFQAALVEAPYPWVPFTRLGPLILGIQQVPQEGLVAVVRNGDDITWTNRFQRSVAQYRETRSRKRVCE